ncbi:MAG: protein translocase subunit SecD [Planctomycetales bacterium]|nr:protein translocase subunit SecD [Planctomycetales bacterium]
MNTNPSKQPTTNSLTGDTTMACTLFPGTLEITKFWLSRWMIATAFVVATAYAVAANGLAYAQPADTPAAETVSPPAAGTEASDASAVGDSAMADAVVEDSALPGVLMLAIVIALFVVPMFIGNRMSKALKMPDHGWKIALAVGTLAAAAVVVYQGEIKFGPDLSGGITLIYELQDTSAAVEGEDNLPDGSDRSTSGQRQLVNQLIGALSERVDPSGTKEVTIREYGLGQIEFIIPMASTQELEYIERRIYTAGSLEFRITASPVFKSDREIIELAKKLPPGEREVRIGDQKVAEWMEYKLEEFGPVEEEVGFLVKRMAGKTPQALILTNDGYNVTGEHLKRSSASFDEQGRPQVNFTFDQMGAFRFGQLSGNHTPNSSGQTYHLGIILDKKLLSAPSIQSKITSQGRITGSMGKEEVDFIVGILNAGSLPATLNKEPISREQISPTLGAETVRMGRKAIIYSLVAVMVFMLLYYHFAGVVACVALAANLLLILGFMVLFKAAFTLPGLAGLVLTIGMSVDANVLIFERIREELSRGAALRMAIRNGFGRATQTIIDANVTTLITAIVIYKIAPDNVKGFGVTLIIGIVMSMYTAIFLSRIVFDIAEKTRSLKQLSMAQLIGQTSFDFLGKKVLCGAVSLVLIAVGLAAVFDRGTDLLNIDFTGGSSVTMVFKDDQSMPYAEVKQLLDNTELADKNLSLVEVGETQTRYTVSCVEQDVEAVQEILHKTFGDQLKTYQIELEDVASVESQARSPLPQRLPQVTLASFQEEAGTEEAGAQDAPQDEAEEAETPAPNEALESSLEPDEQPEAASAAEATEKAAAAPETVDPYAGGTKAQLNFNLGEDMEGDSGIGYESARQLVQDALEATGHSGTALEVSNPEYQPGSARRFARWDVKLALPAEEAQEVFDSLKSTASDQPLFPLANKIGGRIAGDMKTKAIAAIVISLVGIVAYIWFRFQRVVYGLAAVVALIHDVLVTLGMIALSAFVVSSIPGIAEALLIEKFQISLPIVAAFLTIIGYSLNDTIVVFDRIREVKGKSPNLTSEIVNNSINQTLSRTMLTSATTLLSVILLYVLGGDGIHGFAFSLVVGVIVGTYSSIFIASPALLWMSRQSQVGSTNPNSRAA